MDSLQNLWFCNLRYSEVKESRACFLGAHGHLRTYSSTNGMMHQNPIELHMMETGEREREREKKKDNRERKRIERVILCDTAHLPNATTNLHHFTNTSRAASANAASSFWEAKERKDLCRSTD